MKILILGLGNPILGDDSAGWRVAELVRQRLAGKQETPEAIFTLQDDQVEVDSLALGGLRLMERLVDSQAAILIDTIKTGQKPVGTVYTFPLEDLPEVSAEHMTAAHDASLQTALKVGQSLGVSLPEIILVVGIEAERIYDFSEQLTAPIAQALPVAVELVFQALKEIRSGRTPPTPENKTH